MDELTAQQAISSLQKVSNTLASLRDLFEREHSRRDRETDELRSEGATALRRRLAQDPRPKRLSAPTILAAVPHAPQQFRAIPTNFWAVDQGRAEIACPCGETPMPGLGELHGCPCGRFYIYTGTSVMVANGPPPPPRWQRIVAEARAARFEEGDSSAEGRPS